MDLFLPLQLVTVGFPRPSRAFAVPDTAARDIFQSRLAFVGGALKASPTPSQGRLSEADAELVEQFRRAVQGDSDAFEALAVHLYPLTLQYSKRLAEQYGFPTETAEDNTQNTWIRIQRSIKRIPETPTTAAEVKAWTYKITQNTIKHIFRSAYHRHVCSEPLDRNGNGLFDRLIAPPSWLEDAAMEARLRLDISRVVSNPLYRQVVLLHTFDGLPHKEIAEIMQCPERTVITRFSRACRQMAQAFGMGDGSAQKRHTLEEILAVLREDKNRAPGTTVKDICTKAGITRESLNTWRKKYGQQLATELQTS